MTVNGTISPGKTCRVYLMRNTEQPTYKHVDTTSFPIQVTDFEFDKPGPNNTAFIHVYTGTTGPNPCDGKSLPAVQVTVKQAGAGPQVMAQAGRPTITAGPCPAGWDVKAQEQNGFLSCVPNKPAKINCSVGCQPVPR